MPRTQRIALLALAALVVLIAIVVLPGGDDETDTRPAAGTTPVERTSTAGDAATATTERPPEPAPKPKPPLLRAGAERELEYKKGDTVTFRVRHSADEEIHVHGYDKSKDIKAGETVTMSFKANLEGIFEIELEHSGTPIGTLKVEPN